MTESVHDAVSVVLITRNQAENVDRLVGSVLAETRDLPGSEVVLVDSASSDDTVARAQTHPIRVLRLSSQQVLTAAAGRFVGFHATSGAHVLFLDGDMELVPGWLPAALGLVRDVPEIAVVGGFVVDCAPGETPVFPQEPTGAEPADVHHSGGAALYRRDVLERVSGFNPYLYSDEEPELCLRIRAAGFRVVRLPHVVALHHSPPERAFRSLLARRRRRLYLGSGQALRYLIGTPGFAGYVRERGFAFAPAVLIVLAAAGALVWVLSGDWRWLAAAGAALVAVTGVAAVRKRSLRAACQSLVHRLFILEGTIRGFLLEPRDPRGYSTAAEVIK